MAHARHRNLKVMHSYVRRGEPDRAAAGLPEPRYVGFEASSDQTVMMVHVLMVGGYHPVPGASPRGRRAVKPNTFAMKRSEIPLDTIGSEDDFRACVTKRKVSGGTTSEDGRTAHDVLLCLMTTCRKLGLSVYRYLGDRLRVLGTMPVPPLPDLVCQAAASPDQPAVPRNLSRLPALIQIGSGLLGKTTLLPRPPDTTNISPARTLDEPGEAIMLDSTANMYRVLAVVLVVLLFFITGRPYFSSRMRIFVSAVTAGILNAFAGGALLGTPLSGIPLRFLIAFAGVGAGVVALEYLSPEGSRHWRLGSRS